MITDILDITTILGFSLRLILAIVLGFIVGLERQWTKHQAGILTNVIVCVGAYSYSAFSYIANDANVDVTRIAAQVVCGIGFLGAGLILRDGTNIHGLSTAATIWTTAAVGILCTVPNILYSIIVAIVTVFLHLVLHPLSAHINRKNYYDNEEHEKIECIYKVPIKCTEESQTDISSHLVEAIKDKKVLIPTGQEISIPKGSTKLYMLAASIIGDKDIVIMADNKEIPITVHSIREPAGLSQTAKAKNASMGLEFTHTHHPKENIANGHAYFFLYEIDVRGCKAVTLPLENNVVILEITAAKKFSNTYINTRLTDTVEENNEFGEIPSIDQIINKADFIATSAGKNTKTD
ncbi:MAG: MgtC/SapB family protein [Eubacterium sp.]